MKAKLACGVIIAAVIPAMCGLAAHFLTTASHASEPLHAAVEIVGGCTAIAVALLFSARHQHDGAAYLPWCIGALVGMGVLDIAHGAWDYGPAWSWLRALATALGGTLFGLCWLTRGTLRPQRNQLVGTVLLLAFGIVVVIAALRHRLPPMWTPDGGYTLWTKGLNSLGAVGFLLGALYFFTAHARDGARQTFALACHTVLLGVAALLIWFSRNWHIEWWLWHVSRLTAYVVIAAIAYDVFDEMRRSLASEREDLKSLVDQRTIELSELLKVTVAGEERLRQLVESSPYAIAMLDRDMRYLFASGRWLADFRLGLTNEEIRGRSHYEVFPEIPESWKQMHRRSLTGETFSSEREAFQRADGAVDWIRWDIRPWRDNRGDVGGIVIFSEDIGERKRAEDELQRERFKLESVVKTAPFAVVIYEGPDHVVRMSNPKHTEITGGRVELGKPLAECIPELAGQEAITILDEVYESKVTRKTRELLARLERDGRLRDCFFDVTWDPLPDIDGQTTQIFVTAIEVTDYVLARRKLEKAHYITDAITSNATLGLILLDGEQRCTFMNPAAEAVTGYRLHQVWGKSLHDFLHHTRPNGAPYPREECPIDRALPASRQQRGEDVFVHKEGYFYPVAFTASPLLEQGKAVGTVIELRDTTEEKVLERERERLLGDLRQAVAIRDEFLSIAAHELRTPLTALDLQLDALQRLLTVPTNGEENRAKTQRKVDMATRQSQRLSMLVDGLLDVSRIATGRFQLELSEFDLVALVKDVSERFEAEAARVGSPIALSLPPELNGRWDRPKLDQVLTNLLSNALKYGPGKEVELALTLSDDRVSLQVRDHGIGISPDNLGRIFGRFERAVPSNHYGGMGLGLYIAREIAEAHGGVIDVESEPARGAIFGVTLPRWTPDDEEQTQESGS